MVNFRNLLLTVQDDGVAVITINRPDILNALDLQTLRELKECIEEIRRDSRVKAVILQGAGDKAFVAGSDLMAMSRMTAHEAMAFPGSAMKCSMPSKICPWPLSGPSTGIVWVGPGTGPGL